MPGIMTKNLPLFRASSPGGKVASAGASLMTNLAAHWHFDEVSGTRIDSVSGYDLTQVGSVANAAGKLGNAAVFGTSAANYLSRTAGLFNWSANNQFEFACWIKFTALGANRYVTRWSSSASNARAGIAWSDSLGAMLFFSNGQQITHATFGTPATGTWYFVTVGDDGTNAFCTINNANLQTAARGAAAVGEAVTAINFGVDHTPNFAMNGVVDCPSLWLGRALSAAERTYLYNAGVGRDYPY